MKKPRLIKTLEAIHRRKRHAVLVHLLSTVKRPIKVLDVGGTYDYWESLAYKELGDVHFVLLNTFHQENFSDQFTGIVGDARELSHYADGEFDVVFSNAVLGLVGTFDDQSRMAKEIRRVAKRYFVQTPNRWFPLDWRTLVPFFHFFPPSFQAWCFRRFNVGAYTRVASRAASLQLATRVRDLRLRDLRLLFPEAVIVRERVLGFTKSFMVHAGFTSCEHSHRLSGDQC